MRRDIRGQQVVTVVLQPQHALPGGVAGFGVLQPDPGPVAGHLLDPGQYFVLHDLQVEQISGDGPHGHAGVVIADVLDPGDEVGIPDGP